jgi:hypothetical protein
MVKNMATKRVTPGREGYKILFGENTIIMNHKFAAAAAKYGTKENRLIRNIRHDFPGMAEVIVSGRECESAKTNTRLTYENMEKHIQAYDNADELLEVFKTVKTLSQACASPYKYVCDWFKAQFPNYKKAPVFKDGKLTVVPTKAPDIIEYKQKMPKGA